MLLPGAQLFILMNHMYTCLYRNFMCANSIRYTVLEMLIISVAQYCRDLRG